MTAVHVAGAERYGLAEGPVWNPTDNRLLWVDIPAGSVLVGELDGWQVTVVDRFSVDGTIGAVVPGPDEAMLIAASRSVLCRPAPGSIDPITRVVADVVEAGRPRRLNDGAVDPAGRFVVGTLDLGPRADDNQLVRIEDDGRIHVLDDDLTLSNGVAWSTDGHTMFTVDTLRHCVFARAYDPDTGAVGRRRVHLDLPTELPDGIAVDCEDGLWVALYGKGQVRRYDRTGNRTHSLSVPAPHTTSLAFAGPDLQTIVITTGYAELTPAERLIHPLSGSLFTATVGIAGHPTPTWRGLTTTG